MSSGLRFAPSWIGAAAGIGSSRSRWSWSVSFSFRSSSRIGLRSWGGDESEVRSGAYAGAAVQRPMRSPTAQPARTSAAEAITVVGLEAKARAILAREG